MYLVYEATVSIILGIYDSKDKALEIAKKYEGDNGDEIYVYEIEKNVPISIELGVAPVVFEKFF